MATYYFKSPDYNLSGNIKIDIVTIKTDEVTISINDEQAITIFMEIENEMFPSHDIPIGKDEKITIDICNDHDILCSLRWKEEDVTFDRVTSSYWDDLDFVKITEEEYNKQLFKEDLLALLNRYNNKRISRDGSLTERIQRLFKKHFGHNIPPIRIGDLG